MLGPSAPPCTSPPALHPQRCTSSFLVSLKCMTDRPTNTHPPVVAAVAAAASDAAAGTPISSPSPLPLLRRGLQANPTSDRVAQTSLKIAPHSRVLRSEGGGTSSHTTDEGNMRCGESQHEQLASDGVPAGGGGLGLPASFQQCYHHHCHLHHHRHHQHQQHHTPERDSDRGMAGRGNGITKEKDEEEEEVEVEVDGNSCCVSHSVPCHYHPFALAQRTSNLRRGGEEGFSEYASLPLPPTLLAAAAASDDPLTTRRGCPSSQCLPLPSPAPSVTPTTTTHDPRTTTTSDPTTTAKSHGRCSRSSFLRRRSTHMSTAASVDRGGAAGSGVGGRCRESWTSVLLLLLLQLLTHTQPTHGHVTGEYTTHSPLVMSM